MTTQVKTKSTKLRGIMRSAPFVRGFNEAREGVAMDYDAYHGQGETNARWAYERGRLLGIIFEGPLKDGHAVRHTALHAMNGAVVSGLIR